MSFKGTSAVLYAPTYVVVALEPACKGRLAKVVAGSLVRWRNSSSKLPAVVSTPTSKIGRGAATGACGATGDPVIVAAGTRVG